MKRPGPLGDSEPSTSRLRRQVGEQLSSTSRIIEELQRELAKYRQKSSELARERDELHRALTKSEALSLRNSKLEERVRALEVSVEELRRVRAELATDNRALAARLARTSHELAHSLENSRAKDVEIELLEEQVEELSAMVQLLSGE